MVPPPSTAAASGGGNPPRLEFWLLLRRGVGPHPPLALEAWCCGGVSWPRTAAVCSDPRTAPAAAAGGGTPPPAETQLLLRWWRAVVPPPGSKISGAAAAGGATLYYKKGFNRDTPVYYKKCSTTDIPSITFGPIINKPSSYIHT